MPSHCPSSGAWAKVQPHGTLHLQTSNQSPLSRQLGTSAIASSSGSASTAILSPPGLGIKGGGHEASHEVDRLLAVQSLLADQRAPGPERERVADRRGLDAAPEQLAE